MSGDLRKELALYRAGACVGKIKLDRSADL